MAGEDDSDDSDGTDIYDVDTATRTEKEEEPQPLFRIYEGSRIAVSKHMGKMWKQRIDAAIKAYVEVNKIWDEIFRYYNNHQGKSMETPRGIFKRGDGTENFIFSNLNIMLSAVYGKDPDITCSTIDEQDEPFCEALQALINTLFRRRSAMQAKPKIKKAIGLGLLTNLGVLKIDFTKKDDSRQKAIEEMTRLTAALAETEDMEDIEALYGQMEALEMNLEVYKESGPSLEGVLPFNMIIDPHAEQPDGLDGDWMCEVIYLPTAALTAEFTMPDPESDEDEGDRVLVYKPTHKAQFAEGSAGTREDGLGLVMEALQTSENDVKHHQEDERAAYIGMYYTQCYLIWDKVTRRKMLFHRDDWKWPIWVWDDPLKLSRFFPYFLFSFSMNTGGTVAPGETAYLLDQQDEVNDINRQLTRIRKTVFDFWFYNSELVNQDEVQDFINALRGDGGPDARKLLGVKAGDKKISELIECVKPPPLEMFEQLFNKQAIIEASNRISNTNDALRGVQFKTNTNVASVNSYQESLKLSVGAKADVVEDIVADLALSLAELCIQYYSPEQIVALIGQALGAGWQEMSLEEFSAEYNVEIVAGSMEKPNSVFKKKEALEIVQTMGQFAKAAPGATLRVALKVLAQAFTEVNIKKEDWAAIDQEVQANLQRGQTGAPGGGQPQPGGPPSRDAVMNLPPQIKAQIVKMHQQGATPQQLQQFIQQAVQQGGQQQQPQPGPQSQLPPPQPAQVGAN